MATSVRKARLCERAAEMKAAGSSWEAIAIALQRTVQTVKKWPRVYANEWQVMFGQFEKQFVDEAAAESVLALRKQLRIEKSTLSVQAADKLIRYRISRAKSTSAPPPNEGMSAEERDLQFTKELEEEARQAERTAAALAASEFQRDATNIEAV